MGKPLQLSTHCVFIKAPRQMVFEMLTAFGKGRLAGNNAESSKVILRNGNDIIAEFRTKAGLRTYVTLEQVTLDPPERIAFKHLNGPLVCVEEEFLLKEVDGGTELVHQGEFEWKRIPILGYLVGRLYVKWMFERLMVKHMEELKQGIEARAARSHVYKAAGQADARN